MKKMKLVSMIPLIALLAACAGENAEKSSQNGNEQKNNATVFYLDEDRVDSLVYDDSEVTINSVAPKNGKPEIIGRMPEKPAASKVYHVITSDPSRKSTADYGISYQLTSERENEAVLKITIQRPDGKNGFSKPYMNLGETTVAFTSEADLRKKLEEHLVLATFKCCMDQ